MNKKRNSACVTGAAGFIGSHLCNELVLRGYTVLGVDFNNVDWWRHEELGISCERHEVDLCDRDNVADIFYQQRFDFVFHLASYVDTRREEKLIDTMIANHIIATHNLLRSCRNSVQRIIMIGTCEEYGNGPVPFQETQREIAVSPYSWSKICCTHLGELYANIFNCPVVIVRPFLTYGPFQISDLLIPSAIRAALSGKTLSMTKGEQTREFNYVTDIVEGLVLIAETPGLEGMILNLGNGHEIPIVTVVRMICEIANAPVQPLIGDLPYRLGETMHFYGRCEKTHQLLAWQPRVSLREGLEYTIAWYRDFLGKKRKSL
jgi:nucleoside-diphosphate-sugar epimerase